jgi:hypothetical protein
MEVPVNNHNNATTPVDRSVEMLVQYVLTADWKAANSLLYKFGYEPSNSLQEVRVNLLDLVATRKNEALKEIINIKTPYRNLILAQKEDEEYIGSEKETYESPSKIQGGKNDYFDALAIGHPAYSYKNLLESTYPRTHFDEFRNGVVSGSSFSGSPKPNSSLNALIVIGFVIGLMYLINK